jgi:hypothetical protein
MTKSLTIMIIRHGEKPLDGYCGADITGKPDTNSLIAQGWMRSGALARFFWPLSGNPIPGISKPTALFAAASRAPCPQAFVPADDPQPPPIIRREKAAWENSYREQEILLALSALSALPIDATHAANPQGGENLAKLVVGLPSGSAPLIAWEHHNIPTLAYDIGNLLGAELPIPEKWDKHRFDLVWVVSQSSSGVTFQQIPQMLLPGDSPQIIELDTEETP